MSQQRTINAAGAGFESAKPQRGRKIAAALAAAAALITPLALSSTAVAAPEIGDSVYVGPAVGELSNHVYPIWYDGSGVGEPDTWAYCVEHDVPARPDSTATVVSGEQFLGENRFPLAANQVYWVLSHGYPALTLEELSTAAGVDSLTQDEAIEATQYAIWRYTELTWDAPWDFLTPNTEAVYWYLLDQANNMPATVDPPTVSITAPAAAAPGTIAGPFTVTTSANKVSVSSVSGLPIVDASGAPIDTATVTNGQEIYLDLRGVTASGSAEITATATGPSISGLILNFATTEGGTATPDSHSQTMALVSGSQTQVSDAASVQWTVTTVPTTPTVPKSVQTASA